MPSRVNKETFGLTDEFNNIKAFYRSCRSFAYQLSFGNNYCRSIEFFCQTSCNKPYYSLFVSFVGKNDKFFHYFSVEGFFRMNQSIKGEFLSVLIGKT